jgi:hypothetical protein
MSLDPVCVGCAATANLPAEDMTRRRGPGLRRQHHRSAWPINTAPGMRQQRPRFLSDAGQPPERCHRKLTFSGRWRECSASMTCRSPAVGGLRGGLHNPCRGSPSAAVHIPHHRRRAGRATRPVPGQSGADLTALGPGRSGGSTRKAARPTGPVATSPGGEAGRQRRPYLGGD